MLCPNCHSDDVITVQDQLICVNCGRLLTASEAAAQKKKAAATPKVTVTKAKRAPGRPRAAKLDTPQQRAASQTVSINDIRPKPIVQKTALPKHVETAAQPRQRHLNHDGVMLAGIKALRPTWIGLALPGAAVVAGALAFAFSAYLYATRADQAWEFVAALLLAISGLVWLRFIRSAVMYQRAGVHDHRLAGYEVALCVSGARSGQLALFNLRHTATALAELSGLALVVWYGGRLTVVPSLLHLSLIFIVCFALLYLLGSLWVVQRLVEAGIVISGLKLPAAHWLGWRFWRKHWELLGIRLAALAVILTIGVAVGLGLMVGLHGLSFVYRIGIFVAVTALGIAILTVVSGGSAEATYRQLVAIDQPQRASRLLGQRHATKPTPGAKWLLFVGLLLPMLGAAVVATLWH